MKATVTDAANTKYFESCDKTRFHYAAPGYLVEFKMPEWDSYIVAYTLYMQDEDDGDDECDVIGTSDTGDGEQVFDRHQMLDWRIYQLVDI